jgi:hypothetical protein
MSRFLILCVILTVSSYGARCQATDTLCFPVSTVQKLLIDAKQKRYADSLVNLYRSDINILSGKVAALEIKDSTNKEINSTYQAMMGTMKEERAVFVGQINSLSKENKKLKGKIKLTAFGGLALTGLVTGLLIFK